MNSMNDKIKALSNKKVWLAPLAGFTDRYYRQIAKQCGADVLVSEMVSADGLKHSVSKMKPYIEFYEHERPYGVQLFGDNPETMQIACEKTLDYFYSLKGKIREGALASSIPDFFDINMGCPVKKVVKRTAGSALMRVPELAEKIVKSVKKVCIEHDIPLTVKIRAGWDLESINCVEFAQMIEEAGADILAVHPRTRSQLFSGKSNWDLIRQVKEAVKIPVVGNGDINSSQDAFAMIEQTNCDSVMVGRGAIGNPWIFSEIKKGFNNEPYEELKPAGKLPTIIQHLDLIYGSEDPKKLYQIRSHLAHYTKGLLNSAKARSIIFQSLDYNEIRETLEGLFYEHS